MTFDANAYADGICQAAAGSTIEVLVMELRATSSMLHARAEDMIPVDDEDRDEKAEFERLGDLWDELADAIIEREKANGERTVFG